MSVFVMRVNQADIDKLLRGGPFILYDLLSNHLCRLCGGSLWWKKAIFQGQWHSKRVDPQEDGRKEEE